MVNVKNEVVSSLKPEHSPIPDEAESSIIKHLLFHKALISDHDENDNLNHYMEMVEKLEHGMNIVFPDPFDRAIAITFELAIKYDFDPWDVDLLKFSSEYLKHVKKNKDLDLITAGSIILMAWKILKLQSDKVLSDAQQVQEDEEEEFWHEPDGDWYLNDNDFEYTTAVINSQEPPLQEMVWHKGKRRVSLMELIGALEEAKHESELFKILTERHAQERKRLKQLNRFNINEKLHQENLQEDIEIIFQRISKFNGYPIPLSDIYTQEPDDKITTLVSSLFLASSRMINIWQRKFPYGTIFVKNLCRDELTDKLSPHDIIVGDEDNGGNGNNGNNGDNGNNGNNGEPGKILIKDIKLDKLDKKKKKKLKENMEELMTSQKNVAS